jgi:peptide/nickel transport system ATP-binding protein
MTSEASTALDIQNLTVSYQQGPIWLDAVRDVNLRVAAGQTYGLVGESGSGKSTLALAIMRALNDNGAVRHGVIELAGHDILEVSDAALRQMWREQVRLVPQNPLMALNPSLRIGEQVAESLAPDLAKNCAQAQVRDLLGMVRIAEPERVARSYPHQLSGGMQQRVMIAMALSGTPALLVLDEPTTNLDVTTEAAILDLIKDLIAERETAVLFVSHSLGVVARICGRVAVLYAGELVEDAAVADLYRQPLHPYTQALLDSIPQPGQHKDDLPLRPIGGQIPQLDALPKGCVFAPRCPLAIERCRQERPTLDLALAGRSVRCHRWPEILHGTADPHPASPSSTYTPVAADSDAVILDMAQLEKRFPVRRSLLETLHGQPRRAVAAVAGIDLQIRRGTTLGIVGESGSGKTTLARCVIGLTERSGGELCLLDIPLARDLQSRDRAVLRRLQMVYQNPDEALNPHLRVGDILRRPLIRLAHVAPAQANDHVDRLLTAVKLSPAYAWRLPGQLSGGEKQRVAIARAFAAQPDLLLLDESVSALDVSVQATILNLLNDLQREQQCTYLFISHDLAVIGYLADEVAVVYLGQIMELGYTEQIFASPSHPYTEALLSAIPLIDRAAQPERVRLEGDIPSPIDIPRGCPFHSRCPRSLGKICATETPPWQVGEHGHRVYCHIPLDDLRAMQTRDGCTLGRH